MRDRGRRAGYVTGAIGKWHLGLGPRDKGPDYNGKVSPGPLEVGFDSFFGYSATNDRVPTVSIEDHSVVGLDPADPLRVSSKGESWAAGRKRIGQATGGQAAWWKDDEMAAVLQAEAVEFIERNKDRPFFLYYAPRNVHPPVTPGKRFRGTSEAGTGEGGRGVGPTREPRGHGGELRGARGPGGVGEIAAGQRERPAGPP